MKKIILFLATSFYALGIIPITLYAQDFKNQNLQIQQENQFTQKMKNLFTQPEVFPVQKNSKIISAKSGGTVHLGKANIQIPPDALEEDTEITIERIYKTADLGSSIQNVVPQNGGYRFLPAGTKFTKSVRVTLPFTENINSMQSSEEFLKVYFYDVNKSSWISLDTDFIDKENFTVASITSHFTDMITATLSVPETVNQNNVNINSIKNLSGAKPDSHLLDFYLDDSDNFGCASFSFNLRLPSGRKGIEPTLSVSYKSGVPAGILGQGFFLSGLSEISTDTRNGVPRYDLTDSYVKDGVLLEEKSRNGSTILYASCRESNFEKIIRHTENKNDWWEVFSKNGTVFRYGAYKSFAAREKNSSESKIGTDSTVFSWNLCEVQDVRGNSLVYEYQKQDGFVYPVAAFWTGTEKSLGKYRLSFEYEKNVRKDISVDFRSGQSVECKNRLKKIIVWYKNTIFREYEFDFLEDELSAKSFLNRFTVKNSEGKTYSYSFDYEDYQRDSNGNIILFENPKEWKNGKPIVQGKGESFGEQFSASAGLGYGLPVVDVHGSAGVSGYVSTGEHFDEGLLIDINGDGRLDSIHKTENGYVWYENTGNGFAQEKKLSVNIDAFEKETTNSSAVSWNVYGGAGVSASAISAKLGASYSESKQESSSALKISAVDVDGDGLCDILETGKSYYLHNNGDMTFSKVALYSKSKITDISRTLSDEELESYRKTYFVQTPFRMWKAPYTGTFFIEETVRPVGNQTENSFSVKAKTFLGNSELPLSSFNFEQSGTKSAEIFLKKDEKLYFITDHGIEPKNTDTEFRVKITGNSIKPFLCEEFFVPKEDSTLQEIFPLSYSKEEFELWKNFIVTKAPSKEKKRIEYFEKFANAISKKSASGMYELKENGKTEKSKSALNSFFSSYPIPQKVREMWLLRNKLYSLEPILLDDKIILSHEEHFASQKRSLKNNGIVITKDENEYILLFDNEFFDLQNQIIVTKNEQNEFEENKNLLVLEYTPYKEKIEADEEKNIQAQDEEPLELLLLVRSLPESESLQAKEESYLYITCSNQFEDKEHFTIFESIPSLIAECFDFIEEDGIYELKEDWKSKYKKEDFFELYKNAFYENSVYENENNEDSEELTDEELENLYKNYLQVYTYLENFLEKNNFTAFSDVNIRQTFLSETEYNLNFLENEATFSYLAFENGFLKQKTVPFPGNVHFDSTLDFSVQNNTESTEIYSYNSSEVVENSDGQKENIEFERKTEILSDEFLYGGNKGWYFGIWKGALSDEYFSGKKLESAIEKASSVQNEEEFNSLKNNSTEAKNEDIPFYSVQESSVLENADIDFSLDLQNCLSGTVSTDSKKNSRFPFVKESVIHADRAGGGSYYNIEGIQSVITSGQNSSSSNFSVPSIRKTFSSGTDKTPGINAEFGSSVYKSFQSTVSNEIIEKVQKLSLGGSVTKGTNETTLKTKQSFMDLNGDGVIDFVSLEDDSLYVSFGQKDKNTGTVTFLEKQKLLGTNSIGEQKSSVSVYGGSVNTQGNISVSALGEKRVLIKQNASPVYSGGITYAKGDSNRKKGFLDINGDGLPDFFDGNKFFLNNGSGFSESELFSEVGIPDFCENESIGTNISLGSNVPLSEARSLTTGAVLNIGASYSGNSSVMKKTMIDINGDGLLDIAEMTPGKNYCSVKINTGNGFLPARNIAIPSWKDFIKPNEKSFLTNADSSGFDIPLIKEIPVIGDASGKMLSNLTVNPLGINAETYADSLDWTSTCVLGISGSAGVNVSIKINIVVFFVYIGTFHITASGGVGLDYSTSINGASVRMIDLDGDGFVDHVLRIPGVGTYWKKNISGKAGLLKKINFPQGNSVNFEYDSILGTVSAPHFSYVLAKTTCFDGCNDLKNKIGHGIHEFSTEYFYGSRYFDRNIKENFGFDSVSKRFANGTVEKTKYLNDSYYSVGFIEKSEQFAKDGFLLSCKNTVCMENPVRLPKKEEIFQFEKQSGQNESINFTTEYFYDDFGNITKIKESSNFLERMTQIFYDNTKESSYIVCLPTEILVSDKNGLVLRKRKGSYNNFGELTELKQFSSDYSFSNFLFEYDDYGCISKKQDPLGKSILFSYDEDVHQFVVKRILKSANAGEESFSNIFLYDVAFQVKKQETDENNCSIKYFYDSWQRPTEIFTDYDSENNPCVKYSYFCDENDFWYSLTESKVSFSKSDFSYIKSLVFSDNFGGILCTAKNALVYKDGKKKSGWTVYGFCEYDELKRPIKEFFPFFTETTKFEEIPFSKKNLFTTFEYDEKNRIIQKTLPDGATEKKSFYIEENEAISVNEDPLGTLTKANNSAFGALLNLEKFDSSGKKLTSSKYEYNILNEMTACYDAADNKISVFYDLLGRKTGISSIDSGFTEYSYDAEGNLLKEVNSVLREKNQSILYEYDGFSRLKKVLYPQTESTEITYGSISDGKTKSVNRIKKIKDASGLIEYEYGLLGEVIKEKRELKNHLNALNGITEAVTEYESDYLGRMQKIVYPDGETVLYGYDEAGLVTSVTGTNYGRNFCYVKDIFYNENEQRVCVEYGNGVCSNYEYDASRFWLKSIKTKNSSNNVLQNICYEFDSVGNILGYENDCLEQGGNSYKTSQAYEYDGLYQLTKVKGKSVYNPYDSFMPEYVSDYTQTFSFDSIGLGKMISKSSTNAIIPQKTVGDELNYTLDYEYNSSNSHRLERAGSRYYKYDLNGNLTEEKENSFNEEPEYQKTVTEVKENVYAVEGSWGLEQSKQNKNVKSKKEFYRSYIWDEKNRLINSADENYSVTYIYDENGNRTNKYTNSSESLYFNSLWAIHTDNTNSVYGGQSAKHIYLGKDRIVTKLNSARSGTYQEEYYKQYYYHSDHLGSASLISDYKGDEYQRIEYTPYGETWVEKTQNKGQEFLPYKFTSKEKDEETGLYYYGARYLDSKYSRWISTDPALGEYIPATDADTSKLSGMGGVFNTVNLNLYHYAGNNPIKYIDPDGREIFYYIFRDIESYNISRNRYEPKNTYRDIGFLFNTDINKIVCFDKLQTVANYPSTDGNNQPVESCYNDTISPGTFELKLFTVTNVAVGFAGIIINAKTIDGRRVDSKGYTEKALSSGRGLDHSNINPKTNKDYHFPRSKQCFIKPGADEEKFINTLKEWGIKDGDVIKGYLLDANISKFSGIYDERGNYK